MKVINLPTAIQELANLRAMWWRQQGMLDVLTQFPQGKQQEIINARANEVAAYQVYQDALFAFYDAKLKDNNT